MLLEERVKAGTLEMLAVSDNYSKMHVQEKLNDCTSKAAILQKAYLKYKGLIVDTAEQYETGLFFCFFCKTYFLRCSKL